jgi:hypothetical protein
MLKLLGAPELELAAAFPDGAVLERVRLAAREGRESLKRLLRTYGAVPASILGGNYEMWADRFNASAHLNSFPGGSDAGLGWTYLRYPHVASTVWAAFALMYQFDDGAPVKEMANPYAAADGFSDALYRCACYTRPRPRALALASPPGPELTRSTTAARATCARASLPARCAPQRRGRVPRPQAGPRHLLVRALPALYRCGPHGRVLPRAERTQPRLLRHAGLVQPPSQMPPDELDGRLLPVAERAQPQLLPLTHADVERGAAGCTARLAARRTRPCLLMLTLTAQ